uniref:Uncharacterized protein n=1 Tax=Sparus aurata TaxID=8175 RepID=A0A671WE12_SPAAU
MKGVMIFLVLTLVVIMADAQTYGGFTNSGNTGETGGKSQVFIERRVTSQDEMDEARLRRYYED